MEYKGKLYGRLSGKMYFDTGKTADDWDALEKRVAELEAENQALRKPLVVGSACDSEHHAFRLKWVGICYSCGQKEDVKQTDLKCATNKD